MSWWESVDGSTIGDVPADAVGRAFKRIRETRTQNHAKLPTLEELLGALSRAVNAGGAASDGQEAIAADVDSPDGAKRIAASSAPPDQQMVQSLATAVKETTEAYVERFDRPPSRRELLAVVSFVLRGTPEDVVSNLKADELVGVVSA